MFKTIRRFVPMSHVMAMSRQKRMIAEALAQAEPQLIAMLMESAAVMHKAIWLVTIQQEGSNCTDWERKEEKEAAMTVNLKYQFLTKHESRSKKKQKVDISIQQTTR